MKQKINLAIVFGGVSREHEISLLSACSLVSAVDTKKYNIILLAIDKTGQWYYFDTIENCMINTSNASCVKLNIKNGVPITLSSDYYNGKNIINLNTMNIHDSFTKIDVAFPILHGTNGEDGTIQGLLDAQSIPYVGSHVLGSSICMDKDVTKRLLRDAEIPTSNFVTLYKANRNNYQYKEILNKLYQSHETKILFLKSANSGSSVGVFKVKSEDDFIKYLNKAFEYDTKVIAEQYINAREIECAVLGDGADLNNCEVSIAGEITTTHEFYSYEAKYTDLTSTKLHIPADITDAELVVIQKMALQAYQVLNCSGMARIDFFVDKDSSKIYINEVNTIPGFTQDASMFPRLWQASGVSYSKLIDILVNQAINNDKFNLKCIFEYNDENFKEQIH